MQATTDQPLQEAGSAEERLRGKWAELLDSPDEQIVSDANFFGLGGNSMLVLSLHVFVSQEFGIEVSVAELFENSEFGAMVTMINTRMLIGDHG